MKKRVWLKRVLLAFGALVVLIVITAVFIYISFTRAALPKTRGRVELAGLREPVEVLRDEWGIPHVYARNAEDLFFAQGYVHAQDRFWQMEINRRAGAGRLSELFGEKTLATDVYMRTMGFRRAAEEELARLDPETKKFLEAYAGGVNAYIAGRKPGKLGLEFALLGLQGAAVEIEEWTPLDSLTWVKLISLALSSNVDMEPVPADVIRMAGLKRMTDLFAPYRSDMPFTVPDDELGLEGGEGTMGRKGGAPSFDLFFGNDAGLGSNAWVVSGDLTTTGKPILANDEHLGIRIPSIWYEMGLHTVDGKGEAADSSPGDFQAQGFTMPGLPGVIVGHNGRISWGFTVAYTDAQDLYMERINPENPDQYLVNGEWRDAELSYERIDVKGEDVPHLLVVRSTRHGPIVSNLPGFSDLVGLQYAEGKTFPGNVRVTEYSLRWTALEPGQVPRAILALDRARDFDEFRDALRYWDAPSLNVVYADAEGNIGYQLSGRVPLRRKGKGLAPAPGWTDDYEWTGYIPYEELPTAFNPDKGYIVSANNPIAGPRYPYFLGSDFAYGFRARRIEEMIEGDRDGISVEDTARMQADTFNGAAEELVSYLQGLDLTAERVSEYLKEKVPRGEDARRAKEERDAAIEEALEPARRSLLEWDGRMEEGSAQAVLFGYFWLSLVEDTFEDQYPRALLRGGRGRLQNALHYLLEDPDNPWWDDVGTPDVRETRDDILIRAFRKGYLRGVERLGTDYPSWEWGEVHRAEFRSSTLGESGIGPIEKIFNRGPVPLRGGNTPVNRAAWDPESPFDVRLIVSMRLIVDLGDPGESLLMHVPGQSGHPKSSHYDDMIEPWRSVEYHPNLWTRDDVEKGRVDRLVLAPAPGE